MSRCTGSVWSPLVRCASRGALVLLVGAMAGPQCVSANNTTDTLAETGQHEQAPPPAAPSGTEPTTAPATRPAESPPLKLKPFGYHITGVNDLPEGFLVIESVDEHDHRAWIEGSVVGDDRIVINTSNIHQFRIDISHVHLNWNKGIVLRIDGYNSELTRKRWPRFSLYRTATGAWDEVDD